MTPIITAGDMLLVKVPEGASGFFIHEWPGDNGRQSVYTNSESKVDWFKKLPPGSCQLIGLASEIKEEVAKGLVQENICDDVNKCPSHKKGQPCCGAGEYFNYLDGVDGEPCYDALSSLHSLLQSHSLEAERTLILKRQK